MDPTIVRTWRNQHPFYTPAMAWSLKTIETTQMNILFRDIVKLLLILSKRMVFCGSRFQMNILFRDIVKLLLILSKRMVFCGSRFIYVMNVLFLWDKIKTTQSPNAIQSKRIIICGIGFIFVGSSIGVLLVLLI